jgi:hypothetical protein
MPLLPDRTRQALLQLAQQCDLLLFGEYHGIQEVPQLLGELQQGLTSPIGEKRHGRTSLVATA